MASDVYFVNLRARNADDNKITKIKKLFAAAGFGELVKEGGLTAVKIHFGETGGTDSSTRYLSGRSSTRSRSTRANPS